MVPHFDNRINEVHVTCLSTSTYRFWWWWHSSPVLGWLTCCFTAGKAKGRAHWSSKPSRPFPRLKPRPRKSCLKPRRKRSRSAPPPNRKPASIGHSRSRSKSAFFRRRGNSTEREGVSTGGGRGWAHER